MKTVVRPETEMKESGLQWLGEIPNDWKVSRVGNFFSFSSGDSLTNEEIRDEGMYLVYGANGIRGYYSKYNLAEKRILLGRVGALAGNVHIVDGKVWVTEHALIASNKLDLVEEYYGYVFESMNLIQYSKSSAQPVISGDTLQKLRFPVPKLSEQQAIADYLDETCSKIDEIIAEAKASIDEYKELKQSVIFEAVTKGLDKNVEMKDSGVEWIGEIPESWNIRMLNQYVSQVKCKNSDLSETNLLSLSYGKIKRKNINSNDGLLPESFDNYNVVDENDIVLRLTDLQNDHKSLRVGLVTERGIITSAYVTIRPNGINAAYLALLLHAFDYKKGFYGMGSGIRQGLTFDGIKSLKIVVPSNFEQDDIVKHIMKMTEKCDSLIAEKESLINDLEAYKKSLIYEVVTGKRRVV